MVPSATTAPNDVWTADFNGQFGTGNGVYCYPLTIADQHTRVLLECHGLLSTETATARRVFDRVADVDLVGEGVPSRGVGEVVYEAAGFGLDVRRSWRGALKARKVAQMRNAVAG